MQCLKCKKEMEIRESTVTSDESSKKEYERIVYWCKTDDIWVSIETPISLN